MKTIRPKAVKLILPPDLEQKAREIAGTRQLKTVIIEALRAHWGPKVAVIERGVGATIQEPVYPIYGSIPAERKNHA